MPEGLTRFANSAVSVVDLQWNCLARLPAEVGPLLRSVVVLNLGYNSLKELPSGALTLARPMGQNAAPDYLAFLDTLRRGCCVVCM
jgi:hypothetical protein